MITYLDTDIFSSHAKCLVNPVNTVGIMGKGLALEFKTRYPDMYQEYKKHCTVGTLKIGSLHIYSNDTVTIINFPTKQHWRDSAKMQYIEIGLSVFCRVYTEYGIDCASFPKLGCGYGGLSWNNVKLIMEKYLNPLPIEVYIHL